MIILLTMFWLNIVAAFISGVIGRPFWCVINIVLVVLVTLMTMGYENHLLNRVKKLGEGIKNLKRRFRLRLVPE